LEFSFFINLTIQKYNYYLNLIYSQCNVLKYIHIWLQYPDIL